MALVLAWIIAVQGCAPLQPREREVVIPAARISDALAKRFSVEKKWLDTFSVKVDRPKLTLNTAAQRVRADFELSIVHPLSSRPYLGKAGLSGGLGFDDASHSVMLVDPKIETLQLDTMPPVLGDLVARLTSALATELVSRLPIATLRDKDLAAFGRQYGVIGFEVLEDGVRVMLRAKDS